jgi:hypothetical protein
MHLHDHARALVLRIKHLLHLDHAEFDQVCRRACMGALMAARSAPPRRGPFGELISGKYNRLPNTVST